MMHDCKICGGVGTVDKDSKIYECQCSFIKRIAAAMPSYIRKAEIQPSHLALPIMNQMKKHLMVVSSWADMKAVIKALIISNPKKFIKITSDREIRDVYVGSKSRAAKGDEDGKIYNSLEDLMDPPDLMIVRLNELSYKNKAASGALEEAVSYRTDRDRPTWLFNDMDKPFTAGSHAYSDSVSDLIKTIFTTCRIPRILNYNMIDHGEIMPIEIPKPESHQKASPVASPRIAPEPVTDNPDSVEETPKPQRKPRIRPSEDDDANRGLSIYGSGIASSSKFKRKM